jgi:hypothetical protein|tara:strand:- start:1673 stop:1894 length:222 start_codon:yes stop_codon:yes gene_type:complete
VKVAGSNPATPTIKALRFCRAFCMQLFLSNHKDLIVKVSFINFKSKVEKIIDKNKMNLKPVIKQNYLSKNFNL